MTPLIGMTARIAEDPEDLRLHQRGRSGYDSALQYPDAVLVGERLARIDALQDR
jgi:hypothetical protein